MAKQKKQKQKPLLLEGAFEMWKKEGGGALMPLAQIQKITGKTSGVSKKELKSLLETRKEETGFRLDGEPTECYLGGHTFQPVSRFVRKDGKVLKDKNGKPVRTGNYAADLAVTTGDGPRFVPVAICNRCKYRSGDPDIRFGLRLFPMEKAEAFCDRKNSRIEEKQIRERKVREAFRLGEVARRGTWKNKKRSSKKAQNRNRR